MVSTCLLRCYSPFIQLGFLLYFLCMYISTPLLSSEKGMHFYPHWDHLCVFLLTNTKRLVILIIRPRYRSKSIYQKRTDLRVLVRNICYKREARHMFQKFLLLLRTWVTFPEPTWQLKPSITLLSGDLIPLWTSKGNRYIYVADTHIAGKFIHIK